MKICELMDKIEKIKQLQERLQRPTTDEQFQEFNDQLDKLLDEEIGESK